VATAGPAAAVAAVMVGPVAAAVAVAMAAVAVAMVGPVAAVDTTTSRQLLCNTSARFWHIFTGTAS
jgi:hypothetical protein